MLDEQHPTRIGTPRAQHPATWIGPRLPRTRRFAPTLPPDWESQLRTTLAAVAYPARWLDVLAVVLRSGAPDWIRFAGQKLHSLARGSNPSAGMNPIPITNMT